MSVMSFKANGLILHVIYFTNTYGKKVCIFSNISRLDINSQDAISVGYRYVDAQYIEITSSSEL